MLEPPGEELRSVETGGDRPTVMVVQFSNGGVAAPRPTVVPKPWPMAGDRIYVNMALFGARPEWLPCRILELGPRVARVALDVPTLAPRDVRGFFAYGSSKSITTSPPAAGEA